MKTVTILNKDNKILKVTDRQYDVLLSGSTVCILQNGSMCDIFSSGRPAKFDKYKGVFDQQGVLTGVNHETK